MDPCLVCGCAEFEIIDTYWNTWGTCRFCCNAFRSAKARVTVSRRVAELLALDGGYLERRARGQAGAFDQDVYDIYGASGASAQYRPHEAMADMDRRVFGPFAVDCAGKTVLDVSGGPGAFGKLLAERGAEVTLTEFRPASVAGMIRETGLPVLLFEYDRHAIDAVVGRAFDVVLIRSSLNFCRDLPAFAGALSRATAAGGLVYVDFAMPGLGPMLRWQLDRYTYHVLWQPHSVAKAFLAAGFSVVGEMPWTESGYPYMRDRNLLEVLLAEEYLRGCKAEVTRRDLVHNHGAYLFRR